MRELRSAGVDRGRPDKTLASIRIPFETHERHRLTEPRRGIARIERDHAAVGSQGRLGPRRPPQRVGQREVPGGEIRVVQDRVREAVDRLGVATGPREQGAQSIVRPVQTRVQTQRFLEHGLRPARVARPFQHGPKVQPQHGHLRRSVCGSPEVRRRQRPVAAGGSVEREVAVVLRVPEDPVERGHERVRQPHGNARPGTSSPLPELPFRPLRVAQAPVGHGQRIVDAVGLGIECQRRLQVFDGRSRVVQRQRDATRLEPECRRAGPPREHPGDERLGRLRPSQFQEDAAEPDGGRQVRRPELEGPAQVLGRPLEIAHPAQYVGRVVRPPELGRRQHLRVAEAPLRRREKLGGHEQHSQLAVRLAASLGRSLGVAGDGQQGSVGFPELPLNRRMQTTGVGQGDGLQDLHLARALRRRARSRLDANL